MILVTGGTGLAGSHLLLELTSRGRKARALHRKTSKKDFVEHVFRQYAADPGRQLSMIEWVEGDILDVPSLEDAMSGVKQLYHNAALVSFSPSERKLMGRINAEGTANVVNAALHGGVEKLCHISSIATLGRARNDGLTDETADWVTSKHNSFYAVSKYNAEREVWRGTAEGLDAVVLIPSIILGLTGMDNGSMQLFKTVRKGLPFYTAGSNGFIDARDLAAAQVFLMDSDIKNEKFIVSAENLSYREVFNLIAEGFGKRPPFIRINKTLAGLAWNFFRIRSLLTGKAPLITKETAGTALRQYRYSNRKFRDVSGMTFRPVKDTIYDICRIYRDNNFFD
jgi:dihydroflavonol-4-reductase